MLADDGMLYDDVCLGTKATTQRSDTCEHSQDTFLLKASSWKGMRTVQAYVSFSFLSKSRLRHKFDSSANRPYLLHKPSLLIISEPWPRERYTRQKCHVISSRDIKDVM